MNSRTLACKVAQLTDGSCDDLGALKWWVHAIIQGQLPEPTWESDDEKAEWQRFLQRFDHREYDTWGQREFVLPVQWYGQPSEAGTLVRVSFKKGDKQASVLSMLLDRLGETIVPDVSTTHFFGTVGDDQKSLNVSFFGV